MAAHEEIPQSSLRLQFEKALVSIVRSRMRMAVAVALIGGATFGSEYVVHMAVTKSSVSAPVQALADAFVLSALVSSFALLVLTSAQDRHHRMRDDVRKIAELNHQVRNALEIIVYGEYSPNSVDHRPAVLAGVEKIEAALRELFPLVGERTVDRPWEAHNRARLPDHQQTHLHVPERRRS